MFGCFTCLPSWCTFTCVSITLFSLYVAFLSKTLSDVIIPGGIRGFNIEKTTKTYDPMWKSGQSLEVKVYLSSKQTPLHTKDLLSMISLTDFSDKMALPPPPPTTQQEKNTNANTNTNVKALETYQKERRSMMRATSILLWKADGITFDWEDTAHATHSVNLTDQNTPPKLWKAAIDGQSLWVHAYVGHAGRTMRHTKDYKYVYSKTSTTKTTRKKAVPPTWRLHPIFCDVCGEADAPIAPPAVLPMSAIRDAPPSPHWKPRAAFRFVADFTRFPRDQVSQLMAPHFRLNQMKEYLPFSFADEVGLTTDKLIQLNHTVKTLPLELEISPSSLGRWQLGAMMDQSIRLMHESMGAEAKDSDEIRFMLTETHPYVLLLTLCVSLLHTLFDVLAFKSDIQFWRELKTLRGLSTRAVVTSLVCQVVVVAYLHHQETSKLVLVPAAFGVVLQAWKAWKVLTGSLATVTDDKKKNKEEITNEKNELSTTQHYDRVAGTYLGQALYPAVVGSAIYSLLCSRHAGTYDWFISSAVGTVYTFGFIAMTPQLFINYKLRSVAHLPWKFLIFRALNTFIDDLFAFIIRMPTMHRLSCFRDDIVFFIYLYQRWCYPVDVSRAAIGVESKETTAEEKESQYSNTVVSTENTDMLLNKVVVHTHHSIEQKVRRKSLAMEMMDNHVSKAAAEGKEIELSSVPSSNAKDAAIAAAGGEDPVSLSELRSEFMKGVGFYKLHWKKKKNSQQIDDHILIKAHTCFEHVVLCAASAALLALPDQASKWLLLHGRALTCCMSTFESLGNLVESLEHGLRAKEVFITIHEELRVFQTLNNMQTPLLEMWVKTQERKWLNLSIAHVNEMIEMLEHTTKGENLYDSLGLDGLDKFGVQELIAKHKERLQSLHHQKKKDCNQKIQLQFSTSHSTTIVTFVDL